MAPVHPEEILGGEFLAPFGLSQFWLVAELGSGDRFVDDGFSR